MIYKCTDCNKDIKFNEIIECIKCGAELCSYCYHKQNNKCENCNYDDIDLLTNADLSIVVTCLCMINNIDEEVKK